MKKKGDFNRLIITLMIIVTIALCGCNNNNDTELSLSDETEDAAGELDDSEGEDSENEGSGKTGQEIYVYVCGEVKNPGVYETYEGARVYEVIELAGGMTDDAAQESLNLAEEVTDGQQINVPSVDEISASADSSNAGSLETTDDGLVNINTADAEELMTLSGIGEVKAASIIAYRETNGSFSSTEDIMNVDGIGEGVYSKIKDMIKV